MSVKKDGVKIKRRPARAKRPNRAVVQTVRVKPGTLAALPATSGLWADYEVATYKPVGVTRPLTHEERVTILANIAKKESA